MPQISNVQNKGTMFGRPLDNHKIILHIIITFPIGTHKLKHIQQGLFELPLSYSCDFRIEFSFPSATKNTYL